jgi:A/G-specific adenine glycosylase
MESQQTSFFIKTIWDYYARNKRDFAWRKSYNPYNIVVSEIMLQQTQTERVIPKYAQFVGSFNSFEHLACASLKDVLGAWQGLGYNRRALALHTLAQKVITEHKGILPESPDILVTFPGIGKATAASICAFAFNQPTVFIETNIRTVFIHFFFAQRSEVHDKEIFPLVEATVDLLNPREWYYALMDYGVMLKKKIPNPSRKSAHHTQQTKFEGSDRQIRGKILKILTTQSQASFDELCLLIEREPHRIEKALAQLQKEGFIITINGHFSIFHTLPDQYHQNLP